MTEMALLLVVAVLYLVAGRLLYRSRWPEGFMPREEDDGEPARVRRVGRRRVLPVPGRDPEGEDG